MMLRIVPFIFSLLSLSTGISMEIEEFQKTKNPSDLLSLKEASERVRQKNTERNKDQRIFEIDVKRLEKDLDNFEVSQNNFKWVFLDEMKARAADLKEQDQSNNDLIKVKKMEGFLGTLKRIEDTLTLSSFLCKKNTSLSPEDLERIKETCNSYEIPAGEEQSYPHSMILQYFNSYTHQIPMATAESTLNSYPFLQNIKLTNIFNPAKTWLPDSEGLNNLLCFIRRNETVQSLSLSSITDEEVKEIGEALKGNRGITSLNLSGSNVSDEGAKALARSLSEKQEPLTSLDLSRSRVGFEGIEALLKGPRLTSLNVGHTYIGESREAALREALQENKTLQFISLNGCQISEEEKKKLRKIPNIEIVL